MAGQQRGVSEETLRRIELSAGDLVAVARERLTAKLSWYPRLSALDRSWVGLIAQAAIGSFLDWYRDPSTSARVTADLFGDSPRELARSISLRQTVDLMRCVVEVVEDWIVQIARPDELTELSIAVARYSREAAFAAAQVYANAAESRGAWDARLESLVVDAILRGENDDEMASRAAALGWGDLGPIAVVAGRTPPGAGDFDLDGLRSAAGRVGLEALIAVQGRRLVVVVGGRPDILARVEGLLPHFGPGAVVVGPTVPRLFAAGRSARAALSGLRAAPGWPGCPRPAAADDLLPERVLLGDAPARATLVDRIHQPLAKAGGALQETACAYLESGRGIEATARVLFVHPNTIRYRLGRICALIGYDLTQPRDAHVVATALALGRLDAASAPRRRRRDEEPASPSPHV